MKGKIKPILIALLAVLLTLALLLFVHQKGLEQGRKQAQVTEFNKGMEAGFAQGRAQGTKEGLIHAAKKITILCIESKPFKLPYRAGRTLNVVCSQEI